MSFVNSDGNNQGAFRAITGAGKLIRQDYFFLLYLLAVVSIFSFHILSFTVFDGFATFANDAGSYVLLARKWSPFFQPSVAELYTWPIQNLPPGLPWLLAITGASESLWSGHLLVSICMLASLTLIGWRAYRSLGGLLGGLLVLALCLLPGVITSSMGILSENLYLLLSLTALWACSFIRKHENAVWGWYLLLLFFLTFMILTRTIGITLIAAIFIATLFDKGLVKKQKNRFYTIVFSSILLWQVLGALSPSSSEMTYGYYLKNYIGSEANVLSVLTFLWQNIKVNSIQILSSWGHYLSLNHTNVWFFLLSHSLFIFCLVGLGFRLLKGKLDALYLALYIAILLIWPHANEMTRFLHPIVFLLIMQPVVYFSNSSKNRDRPIVKASVVVAMLALIANSTIIQSRMLEQYDVAMNANPSIAHSYEFYDFPSRESGFMRALSFTNIMKHMTMSAQHVPVDDVVATVKSANYSILTDRRAVNLTALVPDLQQICNLKVKDVDFVFLSELTTRFNKEGYMQLEKFRSISSNIWTVKNRKGEGVAYSLSIDKVKLNSMLEEAGYNCQSFQHQ